MFNNTYFTTGEMMDLVKSENELYFKAISGKYYGQIVSFHDAMQWLMWNNNDNYEPISINIEFMRTKWKLLSGVYALKIDVPLMNVGRYECLI